MLTFRQFIAEELDREEHEFQLDLMKKLLASNGVKSGVFYRSGSIVVQASARSSTTITAGESGWDVNVYMQDTNPVKHRGITPQQALAIVQQFLAKASAELREGFSGFAVGDSDSASDLEYSITKAIKKTAARIKKETGGMAPKAAIESELVEVIIKMLEVGLQDKGNACNTHGTLNVAMIMDEHYQEYRRFPAYISLAKTVADKLKAEIKKFEPALGVQTRYTKSMHAFAEKLLVWAK